MDPSESGATEAVRGIDVARVSAFLRQRVPGVEGEPRFELIGGGRSNLTYRVDAGDASFVLRRPPLGHVLPTAHDMTREYRVLAALADTPVPVARPLALCTDEAVNGAPFYVMEYRPGVVLEADLPPDFATTEADRAAISRALVDTLVSLHAVDYAAAGLSDFGRPEGYLERQVKRWAAQWSRSETEPTPVIEELIRRLRQAIPVSPPPTIVHGDYRLGNMALAPDAPGTVVAVFDWEMATLGDPLADLGYTLVFWTEPGEEKSSLGALTRATAHPGFLTRRELVEQYAKASGRDVTAVDFYQVLALYKLAVITEGIWNRHLQGKTLGRGFENLTRSTTHIAERALEIADASADSRLAG
ncbi:MAG: phosphotransferase family protein [Proteobacteria bacterium]|nr:phosphotransferase family protein [Pseudomonadota bacterium]